MLPFLMKPFTLLILIGTCILGELIWIYIAIQNENQWESLVLFIVGFFLGSINGGWTSKLWDKYYIQSLLGRVRLMRTSMGRRNTIFTVMALGVPMIMSFIPTSRHPFLPVLQSYVFGFICGMNIVIYLWARRLPG